MKIGILCAAIAVALVACNKSTLDRQQAKELLIAHHNYPQQIDYKVACGDPYEARRMMDLGLEKDGWLLIRKKGTLIDKEPWVTFSDKSKPYLLPTKAEDSKNQFQNVKVYEREFGQITGIALSEDGSAAKVTYQVLVRNKTPFFVLLERPVRDTQDSKAYFTRYDDGWKVDKDAELKFLLGK